MRFSEAVEQCMRGRKIRNMNWNGKNAFVYYVSAHMVNATDWERDDLSETEEISGTVWVLGHFDMYTSSGERLIGWAPSQADMQSDKWVVME